MCIRDSNILVETDELLLAKYDDNIVYDFVNGIIEEITKPTATTEVLVDDIHIVETQPIEDTTSIVEGAYEAASELFSDSKSNIPPAADSKPVSAAESKSSSPAESKPSSPAESKTNSPAESKPSSAGAESKPSSAADSKSNRSTESKISSPISDKATSPRPISDSDMTADSK